MFRVCITLSQLINVSSICYIVVALYSISLVLLCCSLQIIYFVCYIVTTYTLFLVCVTLSPLREQMVLVTAQL